MKVRDVSPPPSPAAPSPSPPHPDDAEAELVHEFKRDSVCEGLTVPSAGNHASLKHLSSVLGVTPSELKALSRSFHLMLQGGRGNLEVRATKWVNVNLPASQPFAKKVLVALAHELEADMKQAKTGLQVGARAQRSGALRTPFVLLERTERAAAAAQCHFHAADPPPPPFSPPLPPPPPRSASFELWPCSSSTR